MRTTVEIADSLMEEVRATMKRRGVTLRDLVEDGLRLVTAQEKRGTVELPDARFPGRTGLANGVHAEDLGRLIAECVRQGRNSEA
jgi:hypothetical protein